MTAATSLRRGVGREGCSRLLLHSRSDDIARYQMRNESAGVLRRVAARESLIVTNSGRAAAIIGPIGRTPLDELAASGQLRAATKGGEELRTIRRGRSSLTSAQIIAESRGLW